MRRSLSIALITVAMLAVTAGLFAGDEQHTSGLTVYKDPETGRLMPLPPEKLEELVSEEFRKSVSMSHEGLKETAAPGGGVMIDLQGRFQNAMQVQVGADGQLSSHCDHVTSPEPPKD